MECKKTGEFAHRESTHFESGEAFNGEVSNSLHQAATAATVAIPGSIYYSTCCRKSRFQRRIQLASGAGTSSIVSLSHT